MIQAHWGAKERCLDTNVCISNYLLDHRLYPFGGTSIARAISKPVVAGCEFPGPVSSMSCRDCTR